MPSTVEYRDLFGAGGKCRLILRQAWGDWADEFCDGLLMRLIQPSNDYKIHLWKLKTGEYQVNIDDNKSGGYTNDVTRDPLAAIGERFSAELVRNTKSAQTRDGS